MNKKFITLMLLILAPSAFADQNVSFRTPAKRFGSAYSVKITLRKDGFTYDIPVWIKPDQQVSSLDHDQLTELGWNYPGVKPEDIVISDETLDIPGFKNEKSEWAYVPDFSKSCCYGIIGQDILKDFEIRFDPNPPCHLEWTRINREAKPIKVNASLQRELARLFSLHSVHEKFGKKEIDLSTTPYRLNLDQETLIFEPEAINTNASTHALKNKIFQYQFIPPARHIVVLSIAPAYQKSAKAVGFKSSSKVVSVNTIKVASLDHFELDDLLTGKKSKTLLIGTDGGTYTFDFEKNEFTQTEPIPSSPSRN
jgi:hypothetical protein